MSANHISPLKPLITAIALYSAAGGVQAQTETVHESGAARMLEEIVVTARRREEGLQDAPIAISAYTGDAMAYRGVTKLDDISRFVPSLTLEEQPQFWRRFQFGSNLPARCGAERISPHYRTRCGALRRRRLHRPLGRRSTGFDRYRAP